MKIEKNIQLFDTNYNPLFESIPRDKQNESDFPLTFEFIPRNDNWKIQNSFFFREEFIEKVTYELP